MTMEFNCNILERWNIPQMVKQRATDSKQAHLDVDELSRHQLPLILPLSVSGHRCKGWNMDFGCKWPSQYKGEGVLLGQKSGPAAAPPPRSGNLDKHVMLWDNPKYLQIKTPTAQKKSRTPAELLDHKLAQAHNPLNGTKGFWVTVLIHVRLFHFSTMWRSSCGSSPSSWEIAHLLVGGTGVSGASYH